MSIALFRKKPVEVLAVQWTGDNFDEVYDFTGGEFNGNKVYDCLHESWVRLEEMDWIIKGIQGEFYPCKRDIFYQTYERVA